MIWAFIILQLDFLDVLGAITPLLARVAMVPSLPWFGENEVIGYILVKDLAA